MRYGDNIWGKRVVRTLTLGAWLMLGAGCVLPGEFDALDDQCDPPFFDSPTRDEFCSGSIEGRQVTRSDELGTGSQPLVQAQGRFISIVSQDILSKNVTVQILEEDVAGLGYTQVVSKSFTPRDERTLTGFTLLGNLGAGGDVDDAKLALIYDQFDLRFEDVGERGEGEGEEPVGDEPPGGSEPGDGEPGEGEPGDEPPGDGEPDPMDPEGGEDPPNEGGDGDTGSEMMEPQDDGVEEQDGGDEETSVPGGDASVIEVSESLFSGAEQEILRDGCPVDSQGRALQLVDMAAMSSSERPDNSYLIVAVRCAMLVYGQRRGQPEPILLESISLRAQGVEVDRRQDRLYLAAGYNGLYVRSLSDYEAALDARMTELFDQEGFGDATDAPETTEGEDNDVDADESSAEPGARAFDEGKDFTVTDPGRDAVLNASEVAFAADRVFFINSPVFGTDRDEDKAVYLVAGELNESGLLERRYSLKLDDFDEESPVQPEWQLVGLQDTLVAVLKTLEGSDPVTGEPFAANTITIYDNPPGQPPIRVAKIDLLNRASAIEFKDGELWVIHDDFISAYKVTISGEHL